MKVDINTTPEFIVDAIKDYCEHCFHCPDGCVFDKIGLCSERNAFNDYHDKYQEYKYQEYIEKEN